MWDANKEYEEALDEFEMAYEEGAALYWWGRIQILESMLLEERGRGEAA